MEATPPRRPCPLTPAVGIILDLIHHAVTQVLVAMRGYSAGAADAEVAEIRRSADSSSGGASAGPPSVWSVLRNPVFRKPVLIACVLQVAQQLSGINAVFFFSTTFFTKAGISNPNIGTVLAGAVNMLATGLGVWIIDRAGRKPLLLVGAAGMGTAALALTVAQVLRTDANSSFVGPLIIVFVLVYVTFFEVGLGSSEWHGECGAADMGVRGSR